MNKNTSFLLITAAILIVLLASYILVKVFYGERKKEITNPKLIGTWTTEDGTEKLVISQNSLIYIHEQSGIVNTCNYVTEQYDVEVDEFVLLPSKDNEILILGAFEKIEYSDGRLVGSILIHDEGVIATEFRREW